MSQVHERDAEINGTGVLTVDERAELERLRRENEALRSGAAAPPPAPRRRVRWRSIVSLLLIVLGCILTPLALVAVWTERTVSDTDRFVETVSPLIEDPDVQQALTNRITNTVFQYVDVETLTNDAVDALQSQGLPAALADRLHGFAPAVQSAAEGFVRDRVAELVASQRFADAFDQAVRTAHQQAVEVLSGDSSTVVVRGDAVLLNLGPFIDLAKQRLADRGLTVVDAIPEVNPTVEIAKADDLVRAQNVYQALDTTATVLPWTALLLLAAGVFLARRKLRALVGVGLGVALALVVLAVGLLLARSLLINNVPDAAAPATASGFDILVRFLRDGGRALLVLALVVALGAFLAGSSDTAVGIRRWTVRQLHRVRGGPASNGPVGAWVRGHLRVLRVAAVVLAVLVFVFLASPTGVSILIIASALLLVLGIIEFLGRPGTASSEEAEEPAPADTPPEEPVAAAAAASPQAETGPVPPSRPPSEK